MTFWAEVSAVNGPLVALGRSGGGDTYTHRFAVYNVSTGVVARQPTGGNTASITALGAGAYRIQITFPLGVPAGTCRIVAAYASDGDPSNEVTRAGIGNARFRVYRSQFEQKAYATSYMATTTAAVPRNAETLTIPTAGVLNAAEGAISCWVNSRADRSDINCIFDTRSAGYDVTNANMLRAYIGTNNKVSVSYSTGSGSSGQEHATAIVPGEDFHLAVTWSMAGVVISINGTTGATGTPMVLTLGPLLYVGGDYYNRPINGLIDDLRIFTRALSASEIAAIHGGAA